MKSSPEERHTQTHENLFEKFQGSQIEKDICDR